MKKRLKNELIRDWVDGINKTNFAIINDYGRIFNHLLKNIDPGPINIHIINDEYNKVFLVTLKFKDTYPFKPPLVTINTKYDYKCLLGTISPTFIKKTLGLECLCCNSIICKWCPQNTLDDLINEIYRNLHLKLRNSNIKMAHMFTMKYFGHYLPIEEFL
jgi:hypothetical protein